MATVVLDKGNFEETVRSNDVVFVDFWAGWCGPCRAFAPVYEEAAARHGDVVFGKVDAEAQQELASAFGVMSIPTLMAFRDGVLLFAQAGALPPTALDQLIASVRGLDMDEVRSKIEDQAHATA